MNRAKINSPGADKSVRITPQKCQSAGPICRTRGIGTVLNIGYATCRNMHSNMVGCPSVGIHEVSFPENHFGKHTLHAVRVGRHSCTVVRYTCI
jgi:hypothetical protein